MHNVYYNFILYMYFYFALNVLHIKKNIITTKIINKYYEKYNKMQSII